MTRNTKMVVTTLLSFVALFFGGFFVSDTSIDAYLDYGSIVLSVVWFVTAVTLYRDDLKEGLQAYPLSRFLLLTAGFLALNVLSDTLCFTLLPISEMTENEVLLEEMINRFPVGAFLNIILFTPLFEEVLFRYILQGWLKKTIRFHGSLLSVLLSSALFGYCHVFGLSLELIPYLLGGLIYGGLYERTGNLSLVTGVHMGGNLLACLFFNKHPRYSTREAGGGSSKVDFRVSGIVFLLTVRKKGAILPSEPMNGSSKQVFCLSKRAAAGESAAKRKPVEWTREGKPNVCFHQ